MLFLVHIPEEHLNGTRYRARHSQYVVHADYRYDHVRVVKHRRIVVVSVMLVDSGRDERESYACQSVDDSAELRQKPFILSPVLNCWSSYC